MAVQIDTSNDPEKVSQLIEENSMLIAEMENLKLYLSELETTNNHLIAATWRERDLKKKLSDTIEELNETKSIVELQNKRIRDSINYASKIQTAINSTENDLKEYFSESFILYKPKDIISGDFPWIFRVNDYIYIAAADCTGHGVPGAMLSMIGNLLLKDIANNDRVLSPSEILNQLHLSVVNTLKQSSSDSNSHDGMDIGLCRINLNDKEIIFSGAHRPMLYFKQNEMLVFKGDKFPIGGMQYKGKNSFSDHHIYFQEGDSLFLTTDGFQDQMGGEDNRKISGRLMFSLIESNKHFAMSDLKEELLSYYLKWKGFRKQIDDVLIIGIKF